MYAKDLHINNFKPVNMKIKFIFLITAILLISNTSFGQQETGGILIHESLQQYANEIFEEIVEIRRDFHRHPEVSEKEERTSKKIAEYLISLGLEVKTNVGGYGVVGILNGDKEGKSIAWRADIDAMPSNIPDVVDFESVIPGVRHICGHDVHTAIALGMANVLSKHKEEIEGAVYFIFQPSEENYKGAKAMIDNGLYEIIEPDEIYGLHISPFPVGTIATNAGNVYAHTNRVEVVYKNVGDEENKISNTKEWISAYQDVEANSKFWDPQNLGDPEVGIESPNTVYRDFFTVKEKFNIERKNDHLIITATLSTDSQSRLDNFLIDIEDTIRESNLSEDLVSVKYTYVKAVVINEEKLTRATLKSILDIYGEEVFIPLYGIVTDDRGDDFAYFQQTIPGVYYYLGGANYETGVISMPHAPDFNVDEESIRFGMKYFSSMILERVNTR